MAGRQFWGWRGQVLLQVHSTQPLLPHCAVKCVASGTHRQREIYINIYVYFATRLFRDLASQVTGRYEPGSAV